VSSAEIRRFLDAYGIAPKKRWGQNFLVNRDARERIVECLGIEAGDPVWEIGGGTGALTAGLIERAGSLVVFEIDRGLVPRLESLLRGRSQALVAEGDFCDTWAAIAAERGAPRRIVGNLPYRSASRIIAVLATADMEPKRLVFTVQRELAERMAARPSTKAYSSFSVLCQARYAIRTAGDLGPGSFYPVPRVASRIVVLEPHPPELPRPHLGALQVVTRGLFATRRKTIRRSLASGRFAESAARAIADGLERIGVATQSRPEELSVEQFVSLSLLVGPAAGSLPRADDEDSEDLEEAGLPED
jgi:16S rRNA (adenine1518-N6/adenine1519-N6)-dimethyltransferase